MKECPIGKRDVFDPGMGKIERCDNVPGKKIRSRQVKIGSRGIFDPLGQVLLRSRTLFPMFKAKHLIFPNFLAKMGEIEYFLDST